MYACSRAEGLVWAMRHAGGSPFSFCPCCCRIPCYSCPAMPDACQEAATAACTNEVWLVVYRLAPEVVAARQAMLDRCLVSIVQGPAPFNQAAPLLAFLAPPESHWQASGQVGSGLGRRAASGRAGAEGTRPPDSASSASSSRDTGPQYDPHLTLSFLCSAALCLVDVALHCVEGLSRSNGTPALLFDVVAVEASQMKGLQVWEPCQAADRGASQAERGRPD